MGSPSLLARAVAIIWTLGPSAPSVVLVLTPTPPRLLLHLFPSSPPLNLRRRGGRIRHWRVRLHGYRGEGGRRIADQRVVTDTFQCVSVSQGLRTGRLVRAHAGQAAPEGRRGVFAVGGFVRHVLRREMVR